MTWQVIAGGLDAGAIWAPRVATVAARLGDLPMSQAKPENPALEALVDNYIAAWNATDPGVRAARVAETWTEGATYRDPMMAGEGHAGIDAMIAGAQTSFPGLVFRRRGALDAYGDQIRFSWDLGPEGAAPVAGGTDFGVLKDGRLAVVTGFLDFAPG